MFGFIIISLIMAKAGARFYSIIYCPGGGSGSALRNKQARRENHIKM
jgi:hypothetical protein